MSHEHLFSVDEVRELIGDDLTLADSLAKLINEDGDIHSFLVKRLEEREEEAKKLHLSQETRWMEQSELAKAFGLPIKRYY